MISDGVDNGTLTAFPDGSFTYTPNAGFVGTDSFSYQVSDGFGGTDTATVTINVTNINPDAVDDSYSDAGRAATGHCRPGLPRQRHRRRRRRGDRHARSSTGVDNGTLTAFPDGSFTYTPTAGFMGADSFSYSRQRRSRRHRHRHGDDRGDRAGQHARRQSWRRSPIATQSEGDLVTIDVDAIDPDGDDDQLRTGGGPSAERRSIR